MWRWNRTRSLARATMLNSYTNSSLEVCGHAGMQLQQLSPQVQQTPANFSELCKSNTHISLSLSLIDAPHVTSQVFCLADLAELVQPADFMMWTLSRRILSVGLPLAACSPWLMHDLVYMLNTAADYACIISYTFSITVSCPKMCPSHSEW